SEKITALMAQGADGDEDENGNDQLKALLMRRARLLGSVEEKFTALERMLSGNKPMSLSLFYCGDGSTEGEDDGESMWLRVIRLARALSERNRSPFHSTLWPSSRTTA